MFPGMNSLNILGNPSMGSDIVDRMDQWIITQ